MPTTTRTTPPDPTALAFFLHGFPGARSRFMMEALARQLEADTGARSRLLSYPGLHNRDGAFGFRSSIDAIETRRLDDDHAFSGNPGALYHAVHQLADLG